MSRDMFGGGGVWFDGQAFHVPGVEPPPRDYQPFVNPTYDKTAVPKLPPLRRRPTERAGQSKRPARPWHHAEASSRLGPPRPRKKLEPLCPYHTEAPGWKNTKRRAKRRVEKEDDVRRAQETAEAERRREAQQAEAELRAIFGAHAPGLLVSVPTLMQNWRGREWKMVERFRSQYAREEVVHAMYQQALNRKAPRLPRVGEKGWHEWVGENA